MAAADLHSAVLEMFAGLEADERLAGQGLAEAFAEAFPAVPAASSVPSLTTSTSWARVAALLGVSSLDILDDSVGISRGRFPSAGFVKCSAAAEPLDRLAAWLCQPALSH